MRGLMGIITGGKPPKDKKIVGRNELDFLHDILDRFMFWATIWAFVLIALEIVDRVLR